MGVGRALDALAATAPTPLAGATVAVRVALVVIASADGLGIWLWLGIDRTGRPRSAIVTVGAELAHRVVRASPTIIAFAVTGELAAVGAELARR
jgi:hypothetical protein